MRAIRSSVLVLIGVVIFAYTLSAVAPRMHETVSLGADRSAVIEDAINR